MKNTNPPFQKNNVKFKKLFLFCSCFFKKESITFPCRFSSPFPLILLEDYAPNPMMKNSWIDTHCHLEMIGMDPAFVVEESKKQNLSKIVTIATCYENNEKILQFCQTFPEVYASYGLHPNYVTKEEIEKLKNLPSLLQKNPKILAIGECGYDFFYQKSTPDLQKEAFTLQLGWAVDLKYPLVIHSRNAEAATIETIHPFLSQGLKAVLHSFTSNKDLWAFGIENSFYFSFNGISTYKKSDEIREFLKKTPLDRILLETDSPFLAPGQHRGKTNLPAYIPIIGQILADFLNLPVKEFCQQTTQNALRFYDRLGSSFMAKTS